MVSHVQTKKPTVCWETSEHTTPGVLTPPFLEDRSGVAKHRELETNKQNTLLNSSLTWKTIEILIEKLGNFHCENLGQ